MKRHFNLKIRSKKNWTFGISGYSRFYNWIFKTVVVIKQNLASTAPSLLTRLEAKLQIKPKQTMTNGCLSFKESIHGAHCIKPKQEITGLHTQNYFAIKMDVKLHQTATCCHLKQQIVDLVNTPVKPKQKASFSVVQFNYLRDWDYQNPSDTKTKYYLSDLDNKTLDELDIKLRM